MQQRTLCDCLRRFEERELDFGWHKTLFHMTRPPKPPDVEATITFLRTEDGGKTRAVRSGYRPDHLVMDGFLTAGHHEYIDVEPVEPGQTAKAQIWFIAPDQYPHAMWEGRMVQVQEGSHVVGHAKITKVLNALLAGER